MIGIWVAVTLLKIILRVKWVLRSFMLLFKLVKADSAGAAQCSPPLSPPPPMTIWWCAPAQAALLKVVWPVKYRELPQTKAVFGDPNKQRDLLYNGLTLSHGMSVGVVNKNLVQARAQFTGRE